MQDTIVAGLANDPVLSESLLRSLHTLNKLFLGLVRTRSAEEAQDWSLRVPSAIAHRLSLLSDTQRDALVSSPYALFDLRFGDDSHWRRLLTEPEAGVRDREPPRAETAQFVWLALFYAWHVANSAPMSTLLVLGMGEATARELAQLSLDRVAALVEPQSGHLSLRWAQRPAFWNRVIETAGEPQSSNFRRAQLFGLQIAAAQHLPGS